MPDAHVLNFGKAAIGASGRRGLAKRLNEYRRFGTGEPVSHAGGRYIWQLADSADLLVGWLATPHSDPRIVEGAWIAEFLQDCGQRPFANITD